MKEFRDVFFTLIYSIKLLGFYQIFEHSRVEFLLCSFYIVGSCLVKQRVTILDMFGKGSRSLILFCLVSLGLMLIFLARFSWTKILGATHQEGN